LSLSKIILDILSEYDVYAATPSKMRELMGDKEGDECWGVTFFPEKKIYVRMDLPRFDRDKTLLHEFAHVYFKETGRLNVSEDDVDKTAEYWLRLAYDIEKNERRYGG
jgi:hypothetical protein